MIRAARDPDYEAPEGQDNQELLTATFAPDEEVTWSLDSQAFWIDVAGLAEGDASGAEDGSGPASEPATAALEQLFRVGARFTFPVGKYDLATYSHGSRHLPGGGQPRIPGHRQKGFRPLAGHPEPGGKYGPELPVCLRLHLLYPASLSL